MCIYWRQKTAHPTWQAIGTPKSSSLPEFHLHTRSRFEHRTFLWSQWPRRGLYQWMAITLHRTPSYILPETRQKSQHNLKLCKNNATLFWRYIACQKSQHTLKLCKNNAPTCAGLTHTSDSNSTRDRCQQAGRNFFWGQYISYGSLLRTVQIYPLLFFSLTAQLGHILVVPKHKIIVSYNKRFGRVMDTNRPRLCLLVSITGGKCV
jgi:hypothetical protein